MFVAAQKMVPYPAQSAMLASSSTKTKFAQVLSDQHPVFPIPATYPTSSRHVTVKKCTCQNGIPAAGTRFVVLCLPMFTWYLGLLEMDVKFSFGLHGLPYCTVSLSHQMHDPLCACTAARSTAPKNVSTATRATLSILFSGTRRAQVVQCCSVTRFSR